MSDPIFTDAELDKPLTLYAGVMGGIDVTTKEKKLEAWRVLFAPHIFAERGDTFVNGISIDFRREQDAQAAAEALTSAGFTTGRHLKERVGERNRIIGEAMAW